MRETAVPALKKVALFPKMPMEFLHTLAAPLVESSFKASTRVTLLGDEAEAMLVILEGEVEGEGRHGDKMGILRPGACVGEPTALGICSWCLATVRAVTDTRVLAIPQSALDRACGTFDEGADGNTAKAFARLREVKLEQVANGMPLTALNINVSKDCKCVQAISLQASRSVLRPGDLTTPLPETDAGGPSYWILTKGRAVLEMRRSEAGRSDESEESTTWLQVMPIFAGFLLLEALASEYGIRVRAVHACEAYRVRKFDFDTSMDAVPAGQEWLPRFQMIEGEAREMLAFRAESAVGVVESVEEHDHDKDIHLWRTRKDFAVKVASSKAASAFRPDASSELFGMSRSSPTASGSAANLLKSPLSMRFAMSVLSTTRSGRATDDDMRPACSSHIPGLARHRSTPDLRRKEGGKMRRGDHDGTRHAATGGGLASTQGIRSPTPGSSRSQRHQQQQQNLASSPSGAVKLPRLMATSPL